MIWFRKMHEQHTMRFDGRGGRVEERPRTERAGWKKARSLVQQVRLLGVSAVGLGIACSGRCVTQQGKSERE